MSTADIQLSVVFGGQYSFEKLQSDYEQTDALARDYIKNKPDLVNFEAETVTTETVIFDENPSGAIAPRKLQYNPDEKTLDFGLADGGVLQIGKEMFEEYTNIDTVPLTNGMIVSTAAIPGNRKGIKRTDFTSLTSIRSIVGMVTVDSIGTNQSGRVTTKGIINDLNTNGWAEGSQLWGNPAVLGGWSGTKPSKPQYAVQIGQVVVASATVGSVELNVAKDVKFTDLADVNGTTTLMNDTDKLPKQETDGVIRLITYQNVKADLKNVNDALYEPILGFTPEDTANKGQPNGYASLDGDGLVPAGQLPSFVDDIVDAYGTYTDVSDPTTLIELWTDATHTVAVDKYTGKIYVDVVTRFQFRWSGSVWGAILSGPVQSVAGKTGNVLLNKGDVGLSNVDNTSDLNKPISNATGIALNGKVSTTGDETIAGIKTFQSSPIVPDGATGKQAVNYDQMEAFVDAELGLPPAEVTGSFGLEENASGEVGIGVTPETGTRLKVSGASKFGGNDNNVTIDANGNIRLNGTATVWDDIDFPIIIRTTGAGIPTLEVFSGRIRMPQWQVNDENQMESREFIHAWKEGSRVYWHLHLDTNGTDTTDRYVKFELEFAYSSNGTWVFPAVVTTPDILIPANTPNRTQIIMQLHNFIPTGSKIGDHIICFLKRVTATGAAPTNNPFIPMVQLHIEKDSLGSNEITTKQ